MFPILYRIEAFNLFGSLWGPYEIHTYGILVALGFIIGTIIAVRFGRQDGIDTGKLLDLAFWTLLFGLIGARVLFAVVNIGNYYDACFHPELPNPLNFNLPLKKSHCYEIFVFWEGGLVWYGGLLGALAAAYVYLKRTDIPFAKAADIALGVVPLGHAIGRLGCFCAGCCWGTITDSPIGVIFPDNSLPYAKAAIEKSADTISSINLPLHPVQLYESAGELTIFFILLLVRKKRRFTGQVALTFLILYPLLRSTLEFFRGDSNRGLIFEWEATGSFRGIPYSYPSGISTSQIISLLVVIAAIFTLGRMLRKSKSEGA